MNRLELLLIVVFKCSHRPRKMTDGFTLIEVLLAILISSAVVAILGTGLIAILSAGNKTQARTQQRYHLNRALEYITEDVRRARFMNAVTTNSGRDTLQLEYYPNTGDNEVSRTIEYYLDSVRSPWLGPKILVRKDYLTASGSGSTNWTVLVDGISDNTNISIDCDSASNPNLTYIDTFGFQACLERGISARAIDIYKVTLAIFGEVDNFATGDNSSEVLSVESQAFARGINPEEGMLRAPLITEISISPDLATVSLTWSTAVGGTEPYSYDIYRCDDASGCTVDLGTSPNIATVTELTRSDDVTSIPDGNTICYLIQVTDAEGGTSESAQSCIEKAPTLVAPDVSFIAETDGTVTLEWDSATGGNSPYTYDVLRCDDTVACTPSASDLTSNTDLGGLSALDDVSSIANGRQICYLLGVEDQNGTTALGDTPECIEKGLALSAPVISSLSENNGQADLYWYPASGGDFPFSYEVLRCAVDTNACSPTAIITASSITDLFLLDDDISSVIAGNQVCYAVKVTDGASNPATSDVSCLIKDQSLAAPSTFTATLNGATEEVSLTWNNATGGSPSYQYDVYRCTSNTSCTPTLLTTDANSVFSDDVSSITVGNDICYYVKTTDTVNDTINTSTECVTKINLLAMGSINASYDQPSNSATITWGNATGGNGSYTYDVLRCTGTSCVPTITLSSDETSPFIDTISAISSGTEICYRVDVTDSSSPVQTDSSNNSCFTLPASLAAPVITVSSDIRPTVSWSGISGATSYDVYRCQGNSCNPTTGTSTNVSASSYTESLDPVSSNQWCYAIKAKNASGTSDYSNQACGLKNQLPPPNLISVNFTSKNLVSSPSGLYDAYVTWTPVIGAITYELYHCSTGISSCVPNNRITPNDYFFTTFTAANLDSLTTNQHCFAVRAKQSDSNISALGSPVCLNAGSSF